MLTESDLGLIREMMQETVRSVVGDPARFGLIWRRLPATVVDSTDLTNVQVTIDGDTLPIPAVSLIGPMTAGDRVMVDFVPPAGMFIVGQSASSQFWTTGWTDYTPSTSGGGTATFTTLAGRWRQVGVKTVAFNIYLQVNNAGSGASVFQLTLPTEPDRTIRQVFVGASETGTSFPGLHGTILLGGSGTTIDRLRYSGATNVTGADLGAGKLITLSGVYEEA